MRHKQRGLTVIELMVGLTIGLLASVAIVQVFGRSESYRRSSQGAADAQQAGTLASWRLMRDLRMAGAGLQHGPTLWGCQLNLWRDGAILLPRASAWPAPFTAFPTDLRLAPLAVVDGGGTNPDAIVVMSARGSTGPAPMPTSIVTSTELNAMTTVAFNKGDVLLVTDMSTVGPCQIGQVANTYATVAGQPAPKVIPTGAPGTAYNAPAGFTSLAAGRDYALFNMGGLPSIAMHGVTNNSLVQYDVLENGGIAVPTVQAENVENMQVLYGVDDGNGGTANDNVIDRWVVPGTAGFDAATMMAGGMGALQVKSIRIGLVVRSSEPSQRVGPTEVVVFPDLPAPLQVRIPLTAAQQPYARQVYDFVIPLRNQWIALCAEERRVNGVPAPGSCG